MAKKRSVSSRRGGQAAAKKKPITRSSLKVVDAEDLERDPKVRARVRRDLAQLAKGGPIDFSDAPELPPPAWEKPIRGMDAWLKNVRSGGMYKPVKQAMSMRLDADVVAWLKQSGPGYQTRANRILREKMMKDLAS